MGKLFNDDVNILLYFLPRPPLSYIIFFEDLFEDLLLEYKVEKNMSSVKVTMNAIAPETIAKTNSESL
ncbi:hypothetical protein RCL_jg12847.t1 [Rhizophagus clarus]|uniref:Uncharacterized protein n=1 Tax=Rhizophagus clarus TaxID=94130 RepID=A0A8H3KXU5_9GLOM|nr:hypothetical protein RCL_jg12847.t1 [Rhizophagus clarus]